MTDEEVDELFEDIDTDGDGKLDKNGKALQDFGIFIGVAILPAD